MSGSAGAGLAKAAVTIGDRVEGRLDVLVRGRSSVRHHPDVSVPSIEELLYGGIDVRDTGDDAAKLLRLNVWVPVRAERAERADAPTVPGHRSRLNSPQIPDMELSRNPELSRSPKIFRAKTPYSAVTKQ